MAIQIFDQNLVIIDSLLKLPFSLDQSSLEIIVDYINHLYRNIKDLHEECLFHLDAVIPLPCLNLLEAHFDSNEDCIPLYPENINYFDQDSWDSLGQSIPLFSLSMKNLLKTARESSRNSIGILDDKRQERYQEFLNQGQQFLFHKDLKKSIQSFFKSLNYFETAEVLNLIGWNYFLLDEIDMAKNYSLKAINLDPEYGPSYNDLGFYLLNEGKTEESLKWFEMAKKAVNFQNREHPYINSGRAYIMRKEFHKALEEFSYALTLAPYHEELHSTVEGLKKSLANSFEDFNTDDLISKNFHSNHMQGPSPMA